MLTGWVFGRDAVWRLMATDGLKEVGLSGPRIYVRRDPARKARPEDLQHTTYRTHRTHASHTPGTHTIIVRNQHPVQHPQDGLIFGDQYLEAYRFQIRGSRGCTGRSLPLPRTHSQHKP